GRAACTLDLADHGVQRLLRHVGGQHECPSGGHLPGDLRADAACRTGDDGRRSRERTRHADLLVNRALTACTTRARPVGRRGVSGWMPRALMVIATIS